MSNDKFDVLDDISLFELFEDIPHEIYSDEISTDEKDEYLRNWGVRTDKISPLPETLQGIDNINIFKDEGLVGPNGIVALDHFRKEEIAQICITVFCQLYLWVPIKHFNNSKSINIVHQEYTSRSTAQDERISKAHQAAKEHQELDKIRAKSGAKPDRYEDARSKFIQTKVDYNALVDFGKPIENYTDVPMFQEEGVFKKLVEAGFIGAENTIVLDKLTRVELSAIDDETIYRLYHNKMHHFNNFESLTRVCTEFEIRGLQNNKLLGDDIINRYPNNENKDLNTDNVFVSIVKFIAAIIVLLLIVFTWFVCEPGRYFPVPIMP